MRCISAIVDMMKTKITFHDPDDLLDASWSTMDHCILVRSYARYRKVQDLPDNASEVFASLKKTQEAMREMLRRILPEKTVEKIV